ncbi:glycosyltransferase family 2 protein [Prevotella sp. tf2-5]|uniref:glycosyltransferase family 2 protein n=1 Tax=Prevotella sp. tf2-5 TaxID=1761889 RepID=UPI0008E57A9B|nr:glycosyltransferase family 2 protein [Prevotella sp. tf2-5]SFO69544.1 Glycosyltransferase involved in cell wall bisynthesis [Prevotella sp. tf2-5]
MKSITILIPAYNESESFEEIKKCMNQVIKDNPDYEWEFLLINDGSTDNTLLMMQKLHHENKKYHYIDLSRNYGKELAIMAGIDYAKGDAVIIIDADMQHPINVIPEMLKYWEEGYDDVYAQRQTSDEPWLKQQTSKLYYRILQKSTNIPIQKDTGDFRLLDRKCINALREMREIDRNNKGMFSWIGFKKIGISYQQNLRKHGKTKWNYYKLLNLALTGITSFTTTPLRFASIFGIIISLLAFLYLVYIIIKTLLYGDPVQGYPTLIVTILFLGGIQLIALGIIGEYLSHIFNETKKRPGYFVREYK